MSCLAHIRRKFTEARGDHPRITAWILLQIGKIYRVEAELKCRRAGPVLRRRARRILLRRIHGHLAKLFDHLRKHRHRILTWMATAFRTSATSARTPARVQWLISTAAKWKRLSRSTACISTLTKPR